MTVKEQIMQAVAHSWFLTYNAGATMDPGFASNVADELLRIWPVVPVEAPVPSPGYVDREIVQGAENEQFGEYLTYTYLKQSCPLDWASRHPGFMGYVYSDGSMWAAPIRYKYKNEPKGIAIRSELVKDYVVERASHVRFAVK
jgi:hypothetical protein